MNEFTLHNCEAIRILSNHPNNGNSISLQILNAYGGIELSLYDFPKEITDKLLLAFSDDETKVDLSVDYRKAEA